MGTFQTGCYCNVWTWGLQICLNGGFEIVGFVKKLCNYVKWNTKEIQVIKN